MVEYRENQGRQRGIKDLVSAGDRNRVNSVILFFFFIVDCGSNATGFLRDAYEGASPLARGRMDEAGGKVRVQDGVCLLREGQLQSLRARLDRLYSGRELDFKGVQRACTAIQFGRGNKKIHVFCECRAESVDSIRVPTGSVQCKVYPGASSVPKAEENICINSRADIEVRRVSSGESSVALES